MCQGHFSFITHVIRFEPVDIHSWKECGGMMLTSGFLYWHNSSRWWRRSPPTRGHRGPRPPHVPHLPRKYSSTAVPPPRSSNTCHPSYSRPWGRGSALGKWSCHPEPCRIYHYNRPRAIRCHFGSCIDSSISSHRTLCLSKWQFVVGL